MEIIELPTELIYHIMYYRHAMCRRELPIKLAKLVIKCMSQFNTVPLMPHQKKRKMGFNQLAVKMRKKFYHTRFIMHINRQFFDEGNIIFGPEVYTTYILKKPTWNRSRNHFCIHMELGPCVWLSNTERKKLSMEGNEVQTLVIDY